MYTYTVYVGIRYVHPGTYTRMTSLHSVQRGFRPSRLRSPSRVNIVGVNGRSLFFVYILSVVFIRQQPRPEDVRTFTCVLHVYVYDILSYVFVVQTIYYNTLFYYCTFYRNREDTSRRIGTRV